MNLTLLRLNKASFIPKQRSQELSAFANAAGVSFAILNMKGRGNADNLSNYIRQLVRKSGDEKGNIHSQNLHQAMIGEVR